MNFYPTASAANVPPAKAAPSAPQRALKCFWYLSGYSQTGGVFCNSSCKEFPRSAGPFQAPHLSSLLLQFRAEMLDFAEHRGEGRSIFFPLHLDLERSTSTPKHPDQNSTANRRQTTENM